MHHRRLPPLFEKGSHIAQVGFEFCVAKDGLRCLSLLAPASQTLGLQQDSTMPD